MIKKMVIPAILALIAILCLSAAAIGAPQATGNDKLEGTNASPTDVTGQYHVATVFANLSSINIIKKGGPYGKEHTRVLENDEWTFDKGSGLIVLKVPVDDEKEMVHVSGKKAVPWAWNLNQPLEPGSVKILLGDRAAVRGEDFEVDEEKGLIRMLKAEDCTRSRQYYVSFGYLRDPSKPNFSTGGAIGNHRDDRAVRRFLGLPTEKEPAAADESIETVTGTNALPTDHPRIYRLGAAFKSKGIRIAIATRDKPGDLRWLKRGDDFAYSQDDKIITFLRDVPVDQKKEYVFVMGSPAE